MTYIFHLIVKKVALTTGTRALKVVFSAKGVE